MLYGDRVFIEELKKDIQNVEKEQGFKSVFASTIGSISKGIQRDDSDYDVRILYVWNKGMLDEKEYHQESKIRYRAWYSDRLYDCIAFWEIGAFLNFLCEPYIDSGYKYQLLKNVLWSFSSAYSEDVYGFLPLVLDVIKASIDPELERQYYQNAWMSAMKKFQSDSSYKNLMNWLHAYLSIAWIDATNELPPLHIKKLLSISQDEIRDFYSVVQKSSWGGGAELRRNIPNMLGEVEKRDIDITSSLRKLSRNRDRIWELVLEIKNIIFGQNDNF